MVVIWVIVILLLLWYFGIGLALRDAAMSALGKLLGEGYRSCRDCDRYRMPADGVAILNPFVWPYSGTSCVDDLYILNKDSGVDLGFNTGPITHPNTSDHVELVGYME